MSDRWHIILTGTQERKGKQMKRPNLMKEDLFWDLLESKTFVCCGCYMLRTERFFEIYPDRCIPEYNVGQNFQMLLPFMFYHSCPTIPEQLYGVNVRAGSHSRMRLTQEEEEQKYRDYEDLVDEIAGICGIVDRGSRNRINYWKVRRRYYIAMKYGRSKKRIQAMIQMVRLGKLDLRQAVKDILWIFFENTCIVKRLYPLCGRFSSDGIDKKEKDKTL